MFPLFCSNHKTLSRLELNFKRRLVVVDVRFENWGISLGWYSRISPSSIRGIFGHVISLDQSRASNDIIINIYIFFLKFFFYLCSPPSSPRSAPYLPSHPGAAQPVSASPESAKKYRNPATIPETFSTTVDSRGNNSELSSRSSSQSSLSLASTLSPHQTGGLNVGRLEPLIQTPSEGEDTGSELFSPST